LQPRDQRAIWAAAEMPENMSISGQFLTTAHVATWLSAHLEVFSFANLLTLQVQGVTDGPARRAAWRDSMFYIKVDARCDKLAKDVCGMSTVANIVDLLFDRRRPRRSTKWKWCRKTSYGAEEIQAGLPSR